MSRSRVGMIYTSILHLPCGKLSLGQGGFPVLALTPAATNERLLGSFFSAFLETAFSAMMPNR
jgi:hypothetical protein